MELSDFQKDWNQHNELLKANLELNEELLKSMKLEKAKKALSLPYTAEIAAITIASVAGIFIAIQLVGFKNNIMILFSGISFLSAIAAIILIAKSKISAIKRIDFYGKSIVQTQLDLSMLKQTVLNLKKYELLMASFILIGIPSLWKMVHGTDILTVNPMYLTIRAILLVAIVPILSWIVYNRVYLSPIIDAKKQLKELEDFQNDGM